MKTVITRKSLTATAAVGALSAALLLAGPATATEAHAQPASPEAHAQPASPEATAAVDVGVSVDIGDVVNSIVDAVNDQDDRGGAVRAGLDIALTQTQGKSIDGKGPVTAVAIANKNQDITSEGQIWAEAIDIKGGSYVLYFYAGSGSLTNNGDGGWINWGAQGQIRREDNVIHFD